jgi:tetratricopeptide (TPR) repeat protein
VATTDEEGLFRLFGLPPCDGRVLLQVVPPAGVPGTAADVVWLAAGEFGEIALPASKGPALRTPDGTPLDDLPLQPDDEEVREEPLPELMEAQERRLAWLRQLREEIVGDGVEGGPPTRRSRRVDAIPDLVEALNDGDRDIRALAILVLAFMNAPEALPALMEATRHEDPVVRRDALIGLGWLGRYAPCRRRAVDTLRQVVAEGDPSLNIPLAAAGALAELGERVKPEIFYDALRRNDADERVAARGLAVLLRREAIELILVRMETSERRQLLGLALEALTGAKHGERLDLWKLWLQANRAMLPPQVPTTDRLPDAPAYVRRAWERFCRRDLRGARADLEATLKRDGAGTDALELRGRIRMEEGDLEGALRDADHAIRLNPRAATAKMLRAEIEERKTALPTPTP